MKVNTEKIIKHHSIELADEELAFLKQLKDIATDICKATLNAYDEYDIKDVLMDIVCECTDSDGEVSLEGWY